MWSSISSGNRPFRVNPSLAAFVGLWMAAACATAVGTDILSGADLQRTGLTVDWYSQIGAGASSPVVDLQLQINEDITTRIYLIEYDGRTERVSQNDLDAFGKPRGIEGAEQYANVRRDVIRAELAAQRRPDVEVNIRAVSLPRSTIFAVDAGGLASAIDADSGRALWQTAVGDRRHPTIGLGTSKKHVAVVNGSTVYCLLAENGKVLWSSPCSNSSTAPPAVGEEAIYVPLINGRLEIFNILDQGAFSRSLASFGTSVAKPLVTETTVSWATNEGFYSVAPFISRGVQYRLDSGSTFVAGAAYDSGRFFINSVQGAVFAVDEKRGSIIWEYGTGDRITDPPFVRSGSVYVISADHKMYRIDAESGLPPEGWKEPIERISRFVGSSSDRIYALDSIGRLTVLDLATGATLSTISGRPITFVLPNTESDRLYVGDSRGLLQCLREIGNTFPIFHADEAEKAMAKDDPAKMDKSDAEKPDSPAEDDPFADDDPFAAESTPKAGDDAENKDDPFDGDGDDDAGSDDDAEGDDPFAGDGDDDAGGEDDTEGDDPFAGDGDDDAGGKDGTEGDDPFAGDGGDDTGGEDDAEGDDPFGG